MHDSLQRLQAALTRALPPQRAEMAAVLAVAMYRRLPAADLAALDLPRAQQLVLSALRALEEGRGGGARINVEPEGDTTIVHVDAVDGPFLITTVIEELHRLGMDPVDLAHPVVGVERDRDGRLLRLLLPRHAEERETYLALDLRTAMDADGRAHVAERLSAVLDDALRVIADFMPIKARVAGIVEELSATAGARHPAAEVAEVTEFLRWLADDFFVFLGYRGYDITDGAVQVTPGSGLGLLIDERDSEFATPVPLEDLPQELQKQAEEGPLLHIVRTKRASTVHRQVRMISIGVQKIDADGRVVGEHRLLGLLAQKAFVEPSSTIPVLRRKLRAILDAEDVVDHSADERALRTIFDAFPKQELFESDIETLRASMVQLIDVGRSQEVRLLIRPERSGRSLSALVSLPRERFSAELRTQIQDLLAARTGASSVDYQLSMTERDQPLLHFTLHFGDDVTGSGPVTAPAVDVDALRQEVHRLTRSYADAMAEALTTDLDPIAAREVADRWSAALPSAYTEATPVAIGRIDLLELEALDGPQTVRMRLLSADGATAATAAPVDLLRFRLYKAGRGVELSGFLPLLESLGLVVVEEHPHVLVDAPRWGEVHIHDYGVRCDIADIDILTDGSRMALAATAMWEGQLAVDSLNRLVVLAGMDGEQVGLLRAYRRYLRQIGTTYTEATTNEALLEHPTVARALLAYADVRFDPDLVGDRDRQASVARTAVVRALDAVSRLDQDRILRSFLGCVDATLRTNRWRRTGGPDGPRREWLSFKLDPSLVPGVPKPVPYREIFVYSTRMEGIHLRGGPIARGGLRWSDRLDDFRTEVLGLMKAQMSKNSVIVPTGSKGGFVLKQRPADPSDLRAEVQRQYQVFIRGLLDLTDTIEGGEVVPPDRVVRADGDDPYLVVAADRGTATFSDVANDIAIEYGFWLGDAFASGGSQGYDHKEMGITARGAWVAVQRHFRELGVDVQTEPIAVVGVGDMSGDVFGNGMLRSRTINLVAAFDHRDIFIDPTPDADAAFAERERLYHLPRSSWQDYDRSLISAGGGVWSRTDKTVPLSPQIREALRIEAEELSPPDLVQAILTAPTDLLWFGGIGTFVKAREENHADVGDRANDAVRVDADVVGARVIGEGGNLAMTQRARIAYARRGGRCNTDAIDNVAGVNTSDREVNLKILLSAAVDEGRLAADDRDALLAAMTEEVGQQVLRDSYLQTWAVSQEVQSAPGGMGGYELLMADLEARGRLDRDVEVLPDTAEVDERRGQGAGMTRPELAVLLAYAKVDLTDGLLADDVIDQPAFDQVCVDYFPDLAAQRFADLTTRHRLRRELASTVVANEVCNRMGITWAHRTALDLGATRSAAAGAYWIAREVIGASEHWEAIEALDNRADPALQLEMKEFVDRLVDAFARSYLRLGRVQDISRAVADDRDPFDELLVQAGQSTLPSLAVVRHRAADRWIDLGIDEQLAERIATLPLLTLVPGIALAARGSGRSVADCGAVYALLAERLPLDVLNARLLAYEPAGRWSRAQHRGLNDDLRRLHHRAARQAISAAADDDRPVAIVARFLSERAPAVARAGELARLIQGQTDLELDALAVAVRALAEVAA